VSTAREWVANEYGEPQVLQEVDAEVRSPRHAEVTVEVRAVGMNPADYKHFQAGQNPRYLPVSIGFEVAGVISALGPDTEIASGGGAVGDEVIAFQISRGYSTSLTVSAHDVFAKPPNLSFPEAANLLLVGTTAAEMLQVTAVRAADTVLLHGASGAVGTSALQQARLIGAKVIGTSSEENFERVRRFGGIPVVYGDGLALRLEKAAPDGVTAALDTVGSDEAVDVSLALVGDRERIVTLAAPKRAKEDGFKLIGGANPESGPFRAAARPRIIALAGEGSLRVPIARTFPFSEAREALELLRGRHPAGKLALVTQ
jgi:NADPH:quinone reductase